MLILQILLIRTKLAKELNVKPYYIFTNKTLDAILDKRPANIEELFTIEGIGAKKEEEFGQDIIAIIKSKN